MKEPLLVIKMEYCFTSANEYIEAERTNRHRAAKLKKQNTQFATYFSMNKGKIDEKVDIVFEWFTTGRKDHDNIAFAKKFILDGLQESGVLKNDNPSYVGNFVDTFHKANSDYVIVSLFKHGNEAEG